MSWYAAVVFLVAVGAGGAASVVGFGIGSILTPVLAYRLGIELAIPAIAIPHVTATAVRLWRLRSEVSRPHVVSFGLLSAGGGLAGALVYGSLHARALTAVLGVLLILTAVVQFTGYAERWKPGRRIAWPLGGISGFFGGVAGNQGGIRAAALSVFGLSPTSFVATATAVALLVDIGRTPVYVTAVGAKLWESAGIIGLMVAGVVVGTLIGGRLLARLPRAHFRQVVAVAVGLLGLWLIARQG